jgi:uncharacterized protein (TIGR03000 family)
MPRRFLGLAVLATTAVFVAPVPRAISQDAEKKEVTLTVLVPHEKAILTIEGKVTKQKDSTTRIFITPPLEPKGSYSYTLKVTWEPNNYTKITRTHIVKFDPGKDTAVKVDMTKDDPRWKDDIEVRYVATPNAVVDAMCKLAKVGNDDVVYDLGCGDGRMVIRAVEKFGAKRGVGIDLDPVRVKESVENAKAAKVEDRVSFRKGDVLKIDDIPDASVVLLYMGNDINLRLRPILQAKLKPGSRVVSHRFTMGDWEPKTTQTVNVDGDDYLIHLWVIGEEKKK